MFYGGDFESEEREEGIRFGPRSSEGDGGWGMGRDEVEPDLPACQYAILVGTAVATRCFAGA